LTVAFAFLAGMTLVSALGVDTREFIKDVDPIEDVFG